MSRQKSFRQRTLSEAASIEAKTFSSYLISYIRDTHEVSWEEAVLIATDARQYLDEYLGMQGLGQI